MENPIISLILIYSNNKKSIKSCIESILNQELRKFELLCINTGSTDESDVIVGEFAKKDDRVKILNISENVAKKSAVMLTSGDYVCFVDVKKIYKENFISGLYREMVYSKEQKFKIKTDTVYNRYFIENSDKMDLMIKKHVTEQANELSATVKNYKELISKELELHKKEQIEIINNKNYDVTVRFDQLERNYYQNNNEIKDFVNRVFDKYTVEKNEEENRYTSLNNEILKLRYELISEINGKGCEINKVYDEITTNYKYTENLLSKTKDDIQNMVKYDNYLLEEKFKNFVNETELKYGAIKNLLNSQLDEIDSKLKAISVSNGTNVEGLTECINIEKSLKENSENLYSSMNKFNSDFYAELSRIYKEMNDKLLSVCRNQELEFDRKINDMKSQLSAELDIKIQKIKDETVKQV